MNSSFLVPENLTTSIDHNGHGTHTLSTAGGSFVPNVSLYGMGYGTAKGGSPKARLAAYKVCWKPNGANLCNAADIIAGFDVAIHDGVDIISASLGSKPKEHFESSVAVGSFHAMMQGILVVASAGNSGPAEKTVDNVPPWVLTVGASTTDREFSSYVTLGNKMVIKVLFSLQLSFQNLLNFQNLSFAGCKKCQKYYIIDHIDVSGSKYCGERIVNSRFLSIDCWRSCQSC